MHFNKFSNYFCIYVAKRMSYPFYSLRNLFKANSVRIFTLCTNVKKDYLLLKRHVTSSSPFYFIFALRSTRCSNGKCNKEILHLQIHEKSNEALMLKKCINIRIHHQTQKHTCKKQSHETSNRNSTTKLNGRRIRRCKHTLD